eukprot:TRINITY_DN5169_c0_g1_i1.p1 TRINITY_DN5169_c0_g1~~TRINITY_DN5169_c0_g1_i1.p1  ORF type:complete len:898 (-),score=139.73 TRINITY_DN5169_c0_g1_i1:402-3095(-)
MNEQQQQNDSTQQFAIPPGTSSQGQGQALFLQQQSQQQAHSPSLNIGQQLQEQQQQSAPSYSLFLNNTIWTPQPSAESQSQQAQLVSETGSTPVQKQHSGLSNQVISILSDGGTENMTGTTQHVTNGSQIAQINLPVSQAGAALGGSGAGVWETQQQYMQPNYIQPNQNPESNTAAAMEHDLGQGQGQDRGYTVPSAPLLQFYNNIYGSSQVGAEETQGQAQQGSQIYHQQDKVLAYLQSQHQGLQYEQHPSGTPHPPQQVFDVEDVNQQFSNLMLEVFKEQHGAHQVAASTGQQSLIGDQQQQHLDSVSQQQQKQAALIQQLLQQHHLNPASLALSASQLQHLQQQLQLLYQYNQQQPQQNTEQLAQQQQQLPDYNVVLQQYQTLLAKLVQLHQSGQLANIQPAALANLLMGQQHRHQVAAAAQVAQSQQQQQQQQQQGSSQMAEYGTASSNPNIFEYYGQGTGQQQVAASPAPAAAQSSAELSDEQARIQQPRSRQQSQQPADSESVPVMQYEKLRRENIRLQNEADRLQKEVQRQKSLREDDRQEFLAAKERLKKGWAQDREDFARVKEQLKKKNADHHVQNGRLAQQCKEAEQMIRSLREFCAQNNVQLPPELESATNTRARSRVAEDSESQVVQSTQVQPQQQSSTQVVEQERGGDENVSVFSKDESSVQVDMDAVAMGEEGEEPQYSQQPKPNSMEVIPRTPQSEPADQEESADIVTKQAVRATAEAAAALSQLALTLAQQMPSEQPLVAGDVNLNDLSNALTSLVQSVPDGGGASSATLNSPQHIDAAQTAMNEETPKTPVSLPDAMDQIVGNSSLEQQVQIAQVGQEVSISTPTKSQDAETQLGQGQVQDKVQGQQKQQAKMEVVKETEEEGEHVENVSKDVSSSEKQT